MQGIKVRSVLSLTPGGAISPLCTNINLVPASLFDATWDNFLGTIEGKGETTDVPNDDGQGPVGVGKDWQDFLDVLRQLITGAFEAHHNDPKAMATYGDTEGIWNNWNNIVENLCGGILGG